MLYNHNDKRIPEMASVFDPIESIHVVPKAGI